MNIKSHTISALVITIYVFASFNLNAAQKELQLVDWNSEQGIQRIAESRYKSDFFQLANHFQSQPNGVVCGPTTGSIVLNALRLRKKDNRLPYMSIDQRDTKFIPREPLINS